MENTSHIISPVFNFGQLTRKQFEKLSAYIFNDYGIKMPEEKKVILQCRLQKRLRALRIDNFTEYVNYLFSKEGQKNEVIHMIDVVCTNKTEFFRESEHFDVLSNSILPEIISNPRFQEPVNIWSAGCSSGEEAFTIAIVIEEFQEKNRFFKYKIHGSDISSRIIKQAQDAIYPDEKTTSIPSEIKRKHFLKSKDRSSPMVRIKPYIRSKTVFSRQNLMDDRYDVPNKLDIIFCRNVLIYFNRPTQEMVLKKLINRLKSGGYLFLGHSESITDMGLPLSRIKPTIFKKENNI